MWKQRIEPGERVPLKLTPTETKLILEELTCLDTQYQQILQATPAGKPVMMTLDDLDDFGDYIAAEANHTDDKKLARILDRAFDKCQRLLDTYTDERDNATTAEKQQQRPTKVISAVVAGDVPATISPRLKSKTPKSTKFPLKITKHQRDSLLLYTRLTIALKQRVKAAEEGTQIIKCTKQELDHMLDEICQAVVYARSPHKQRLVAIQKKVDNILDEIPLGTIGTKGPKQRGRPASESETLIQLKVVGIERLAGLTLPARSPEFRATAHL